MCCSVLYNRQLTYCASTLSELSIFLWEYGIFYVRMPPPPFPPNLLHPPPPQAWLGLLALTLGLLWSWSVRPRRGAHHAGAGNSGTSFLGFNKISYEKRTPRTNFWNLFCELFYPHFYHNKMKTSEPIITRRKYLQYQLRLRWGLWITLQYQYPQNR